MSLLRCHPGDQLSVAGHGGSGSPNQRGVRGVMQELVSRANSSPGLFVHAGVDVCVAVRVATLPRLAHFNAAFSPDENIHILINKKKMCKV